MIAYYLYSLRMIEKGIANKEEIDIDTLEYRLHKEREKTNYIDIKEKVFCATAQKSCKINI